MLNGEISRNFGCSCQGIDHVLEILIGVEQVIGSDLRVKNSHVGNGFAVVVFEITGCDHRIDR